MDELPVTVLEMQHAREAELDVSLEAASNSARPPAHPTLPSLIAWTSPISTPGIAAAVSRIIWIQTRAAVSPSCHHLDRVGPESFEPGWREIRLLTASSSPSRRASKKRVTTCRISSEGSTRGVSPAAEL